MRAVNVWRFNFTGWLLFTGSAIGFLASTWSAGDMMGVIASLLFLVACIVFLIPVWVGRPGRPHGD